MGTFQNFKNFPRNQPGTDALSALPDEKRVQATISLGFEPPALGKKSGKTDQGAQGIGESSGRTNQTRGAIIPYKANLNPLPLDPG